MKRLRGTGLPNVWLLNGYHESAEGISYEDLDGLYVAIARAISLRVGPLTGPEVKFLRKRLGMTQDEVGALGGKSGQIAAKWEKGSVEAPRAESTLLRLIWLERNERKYVAPAVRSLCGPSDQAQTDYVFRLTDCWREEVNATVALVTQSAAVEAGDVIRKAMATADGAVATLSSDDLSGSVSFVA